MEVVYVAVAALSLLSVGQAAPMTSCKTLTQPVVMQGREQLLGKWIFIAESTDITGTAALTKLLVESVWSKITAANESDAINLHQVQRMLGRCFSVTAKMTLRDNTLYMVQPYSSQSILLNTGCSDCLVILSKSIIQGRTLSGMQLISKRSNVSVAEIQEFRRQVECLNLPQPAVMDPENGFCSDDSPSTDLTSAINDTTLELFDMLGNILSNEGGLKNLIKQISSDGAGLKENPQIMTQ